MPNICSDETIKQIISLKAQGISTKEVARKLGLTSPTVLKWNNISKGKVFNLTEKKDQVLIQKSTPTLRERMWTTEANQDELRSRIKQTTGKQQKKYQALLAVLMGVRTSEIVKNLKVSDNAVADWVKRFQENGYEGLEPKENSATIKKGSQYRPSKKIKVEIKQELWKSFKEYANENNLTRTEAIEKALGTIMNRSFASNGSGKGCPQMVAYRKTGLFKRKSQLEMFNCVKGGCMWWNSKNQDCKAIEIVA